MYKKTKHPTYCFRLEEKLAKKLDRRITRAGFSSRSDFFAAIAYITLYGVETANQPQMPEKTSDLPSIPEQVSQWIRETTPRISEEEIFRGLHTVIEEMLVPVIAMKGVDIAYENTWEDVREVFHCRYGVWVTESDLREAYVSFAAVRKAELAEYRERQLRASESAEE